MSQRSMLSRPLPALAITFLFSLFVAAPTPGNVGGCGGSLASRPITAGNLNAQPPETLEYMYWDRGFCSHLCQRLLECHALCISLAPSVDGCNDSADYFAPANQLTTQAAYRQCVRGGLRQDIFGLNQCPHACPNGMRPNYTPTEWDVQTCGDAVMQLGCEQLPRQAGTVFGAFGVVPPECSSTCR